MSQPRYKNLKVWWGQFWHWFLEAKHVWFALLGVVAAIIICLTPGHTEQKLRMSGLVLQVLGILTVVWGIHETRKMFDRPSIFHSVKSWLSRFPTLKNRTYTASGTATIPAPTVSGRGYVSSNPSSTASLESRVDELEKRLASANRQFFEYQGQVEDQFREVKQTLKEEGHIRDSRDETILNKIETTELGGIHISAIGTVWLLIGVILSTIPNELIKLFS